MKRLKTLSRCLLLRRPKGVISLPPRDDLRYAVEFTAAERQVYDNIRMQVVARLDEQLHVKSSQEHSPSFVNVLQRIEAMRMVCDLGLHYHERHSILQKQPEADSWQHEAQQALHVLCEMGPLQCRVCFATFSTADHISDMPPPVQALLTRCLVFVCQSCCGAGTGMDALCEHIPRCSIASVSMDPNRLEASEALTNVFQHNLPSKVQRL